ncbi:MAG: hypothetical protein MZV64_38625 [Ignavibacteriales bacterium]|nr:hypothetical protein [Ignavibacteriales bacterium]
MNAVKTGGGSEGHLQFDVVSKGDLTGDKYQVTFFADKFHTEIFYHFWKLANATKGSSS